MNDPMSTAIACAQLAHNKKAKNIVILDLRGLTDVTDFFVVASVMPRQGKAITEELRKTVKQSGAPVLGTEGDKVGAWILLDFVDVIVHLFADEARTYYDIENLWGDAPRIAWEAEGAKDSTAT